MKSLLVISLVVGLLAASAFSHSSTWHPTREALEAWTCGEDSTPEKCIDFSKDSVRQIFGKALKRFESLVTSADSVKDLLSHIQSPGLFKAFAPLRHLYANGKQPTLHEIGSTIRAARNPKRLGGSNSSYPYFSWIPTKVGGAIPDGPVLQYSTSCFGSTTVIATTINASFVQVTVTTSQQLQWFCADAYLLFAAGSLAIHEFDEEKTYTFMMDMSSAYATSSGKWYVANKGILFLRFRDNLIDTIGELVDTATLLLGFESSPIPEATFNANLYFVQNYIEASPRLQPKSVLRTSGNTVALELDPTYIQSGDALFVLRPDGLDPMIGWGEGDTVGHSTVALWINGALHVCESTTLDAYWARNGIQCHQWTDWIALCTKAQMNVMLLPLSPAASAAFDATKAYDFFTANEGLDYGFQTFVFGWLDTVEDNFPCVPDDYKTCLTSAVAEVLAIIFDHLFGSETKNFFRQALQHRAGTWPSDDTVLDLIRKSNTDMNLTFGQLVSLPEQDSWLYNTTRYGEPAIGKSMVCCVFVCNMWKAAGVFGDLKDSIQCGEQTLWDIWSMQIFDSAKMGSGRPLTCQIYDPENELCQIMGNFTVQLKPDVNTRPLYANMGEKCESRAPDYIRSPGC